MNQGAREQGFYAADGSKLRAWKPLSSDSALFWIDQICIDQSRTNERNHQVKIMSSIYTSAESVIIWLRAGEKKPAIADISQNQYWSRLWVIQEIMLAKSLLLLHAGILRYWQHLRVQLCETGFKSECPNIVIRKVIPSIITNKFALHRALELFPAHDCHDSRDKVYGLMGIVHEKERIEIDYNKNAPVIYWDAIAGLRAKELKDPDRIMELGREMGVTDEEDIKEEVAEKFRFLFGGKDPKTVFETI